MGDPYHDWLRERDSELAALRGLGGPQPAKPSLEADVFVPVLQGLALALVGGLAAGTAAVLIGFGAVGWARWALAGKVAGGVFVGILALATIKLVLDHHRSTRDPYDLARWRFDAARASTAARPDPNEDPPFVIVHGRTPALPATVDHVVESIEPAVDPAIRELYDFIIDAWRTQDVSQTGTMARAWSRRDWDRFVGGSRRRSDVGKDSARGLLDRAGLVSKDGNAWRICATLQDALSMNDALLTYAQAKSRMVRLDQADKTSQDRTGVRETV